MSHMYMVSKWFSHIWKRWKTPSSGNQIPVWWFSFQPSDFDHKSMPLEGVNSDVMSINTIFEPPQLGTLGAGRMRKNIRKWQGAVVVVLWMSF